MGSTSGVSERNLLAVNLLILVLALCFCFLIGEGVVRLLVRTGGLTALDKSSGAIILDPERGWRINPAYTYSGEQKSKDGTPYRVSISFKSSGFRTYGNPKSGQPRLMVLGDSFTEALQVSDDRAYYSILGKGLGREIFAYGCDGYGTMQEYQVLDRFLDEVRPKALLWQFCFNDFVNNDVDLETASTRNNNGLTRPYWVNGRIEYQLPRPLVERTVRKAFGWSQFARFLFNRLDKIRATNPDRSVETELVRQGFNHPGFARAMQTTDALFAKVRARIGTMPVYALYVNGLRPAEDAPAREAFRQICTKYDITFIDSDWAIGPAEQRGEVVRHADGAHWNERGHQLVADLLVRHLGTIVQDGK